MRFRYKLYLGYLANVFVTCTSLFFTFNSGTSIISRYAGLASILLLSAFSVVCLMIIKKLKYLNYYLEGSLDAMEAPITTTDLDMNWKFINTVTESLLSGKGIDKNSCQGKHCSNWEADICNTDKCGINSLRSGQPTTFYQQEYPDGSPSTAMKVKTDYILDDEGRKIGHVEVVTNVDAANKLKDIAKNIAASSEEVSASLEEMGANAKNIADNTTPGKPANVTV